AATQIVDALGKHFRDQDNRNDSDDVAYALLDTQSATGAFQALRSIATALVDEMGKGNTEKVQAVLIEAATAQPNDRRKSGGDAAFIDVSAFAEEVEKTFPHLRPSAKELKEAIGGENESGAGHR